MDGISLSRVCHRFDTRPKKFICVCVCALLYDNIKVQVRHIIAVQVRHVIADRLYDNRTMPKRLQSQVSYSARSFKTLTHVALPFALFVGRLLVMSL